MTSKTDGGRAIAMASEGRFSLVVGGPFHALLRRFGGLGDDGLPTPRVAFVLALVAWGLPGLAAALQTAFDASYSGFSYFSDATAVARFLVAVPVLIATERHAERRVVRIVEQFRAAGIVREAELPAFERALDEADRRSSSALAEGLLALTAFAAAAAGPRIAVEITRRAWEGRLVDGGIELAWAGYAVSWFSGPLFVFLVLRWGWRFVVWSLLLFRLSRMRLALSPVHPDRSGGLGFLAIFPTIFTGFVFALSSVVAVTVLRELRFVALSDQQVQLMLGGWLVFVLALFFGPLLVFVPILRELRDDAVLEYGRLVHHHHQSFAGKWLEPANGESGLLGSPDASSSADLNALVAVVDEMRLLPVDRESLVQVLAAAGAPLLAVLATRIPLAELVKRLAMGFV